jgi:hypothetical protein
MEAHNPHIFESIQKIRLGKGVLKSGTGLRFLHLPDFGALAKLLFFGRILELHKVKIL